MWIPSLITAGIAGLLYASRSTSPRAVSAQVKPFEVVVDPVKYGANAPGVGGKKIECANNPACDAYQALIDLGYTSPRYLGSDDPDLARFRQGRSVTFAFDVTGDLNPDRDVPSWMFYAPRDPSPATTARFR